MNGTQFRGAMLVMVLAALVAGCSGGSGSGGQGEDTGDAGGGDVIADADTQDDDVDGDSSDDPDVDDTGDAGDADAEDEDGDSSDDPDVDDTGDTGDADAEDADGDSSDDPDVDDTGDTGDAGDADAGDADAADASDADVLGDVDADAMSDADAPDDADTTSDADTTDDADATPDADAPDDADATELADSAFTAVWANTGGDKVTRDELRASGDPSSVLNSAWDGETISIWGAQNEVLAFNLVLEAGADTVEDVEVRFDRLVGPDGDEINSRSVEGGDDVFDWTGRNIELFYVRYLQIRGLSRLAYESYDERHIPERFRRPWEGDGWGDGSWEDRPDHDKYYPDIAVPLELVDSFDVASGQNQSIWADVYVPRDAAPGDYHGHVEIRESGELTRRVPVTLTVRDFALPDVPRARTMVYLGYGDINNRYIGERWPVAGPDGDRSQLIRDRHWQLAHRHRMSLIDSNASASPGGGDRPVDEWEPRLSGELFTPDQGYDGPGVGVGNGIFSVGTYGGWGWKDEGEAGMRSHTDGWVTWFADNAPDTDYFLYLIDESSDWEQIETWAAWMDDNPGPGSAMPSFATAPMPPALANAPSLDIACSTVRVGITSEWEAAASTYRTGDDHRLYMYNGSRPATGSWAIEDDGVALRTVPWAQVKMGVEWWFFWESTYYNNFQGGTGETNVFASAFTFGTNDRFDEELGRTGWNYTNGDGVLFYPGTDTVYPEESYGVDGPFASLRLKLWRRGIQDADYLEMAAAIDPERVQEIIDEIIPVVLWEVGVNTVDDPTWVRRDISWSTDPDVWEAARAELADIIESE